MQANLKKRAVTLPNHVGGYPHDDEKQILMTMDEYKLHRWLVSTRQREIMLTAKAREQSAIDEDYYDGDQWDENDKIILQERGQAALVFNEIKPAIDWIIGEEKRKRMDFHVYGRAEDDAETSVVKQKLIKYLSDTNRIGWQRSEAFSEMVKAGKGWTEICVEPDEAGDPKIVFRFVSWRNIVEDSSSKCLDMSDSRYLFRDKIVDLEEACAWFPELTQKLTIASEERDLLETQQIAENYFGSPLSRTGFFSVSQPTMLDMGSRPAIQLYECWYKKYEQVEVLRRKGKKLHGKVYDENNQEHQQAVNSGEYQLFNTARACMRVAIFCDQFLLVDAPSPYEHNRFPFVRRTAYRKSKDNSFYGVIRQIRDVQDDLNKQRSKYIHTINSRRVLIEDGAVDDIELFREEYARPDAVLPVNRLAGIKPEETQQLAEAHVRFSMINSATIRNVSGVTGEQQGLETNTTSGVALRQRAEQGGIITTTLFDNHRLAHQLEGEILLSLIEQFMTDEQVIRIIGDNGKPEYVSINNGSTSITESQADFIMDEEDYRIGVKMALSDRLMDISTRFAQIGQLQIAVSLVIMAFEMQDLPNRERILQQIREMTNMPDPNEPDEQRDARKQAEQAAQQQKQELETRKIMADILRIEGEAKKAQADAGIKEVQDLKEKLLTFEQAIKSAEILQTMPQLGSIVDDLIQNVTNILATQPEQPIQQTQPQAQNLNASIQQPIAEVN